MPTEIKIPAVGESITEVTIAKWLKKDGEAVKRDEVIAELESDKATFELPAEADGVLKIRVAEGETIGIGTVIAELDGAASAPQWLRRPLPPHRPPRRGRLPLDRRAKQNCAGQRPGRLRRQPRRPSRRQPTPGAGAMPPRPPAVPAAVAAAVEMKIPAVGESITEVTVAKWLKPDGAQVKPRRGNCRAGIGQGHV
ncbi:MAG: biotin/lipoyl-containing protein [Hymenobacter sp.]